MATVADWIEGARLRTLPAAFSPVLAGTAVAVFYDGFRWERALLALVVALALQVGVNFANDYSDGVRGTDSAELRSGPQRLVGSGVASPAVVKRAAFGCFAIAAAAGLALTLMTQAWWLLAVGAAAIVAAWFYTGGKHPYGYAGLGEVFVFVFFGLVAVAGTTFVQLGRVPEASWWAALAVGSLACAILVCNNLRDIAGDAQVGKRTLAVRLGDRNTRWFFVVLIAATLFGVVQVAAATSWWALLGLVGAVFLIGPVRLMLDGASGLLLIHVLKLVGIAELVCSAGLLVGLAIA
ncbi:1,4-dihydroxy-2-naphthoate polyprenyltransferase [Nigerium massiliense]|uniref:1,4-dihydroxy-2-naphthoate polyprenyltransferase n=1 Tax=Nigerium massiliense TaxID=1522317 RepID=UPI00058FB410|nr:1,4-dihydroxy-2-naphthoate polyprenyltransferase [Nigerium massiliense]